MLYKEGLVFVSYTLVWFCFVCL